MFSEFQTIFKNNIPTQQIPNHKVPRSYRISGRQIQEQKLLSEGAFGYIWRAIDISTKQVFALKRIICTNKQRLDCAKFELEVMKKLKPSPHLVGFYGGQIINQHDKNIVIILMEMCPNGTLFDQLVSKQGTGFTQSQLLRILQSISKGILSVNSSGYAHRDIKIQNVLIGRDMTFKLCDFGSCTNKEIDFSKIPQSKYSDYEQELQKNTTPMYRPPQIVDPFLKYKVTEKVDVWMLGCVLFTLCYYVHPFIQGNKIAISRAIYKIPKESKYSEKINDLIRHMLTPNPLYRPSITQILEILKNWKSTKNISLNEEAKILKTEQLQKQKQLEVLNKKVVDFDGDIPMEHLLKLQQQLKPKQEETVTSFIKPKTQKKIIKVSSSQSNNSNNNNNNSNNLISQRNNVSNTTVAPNNYSNNQFLNQTSTNTNANTNFFNFPSNNKPVDPSINFNNVFDINFINTKSSQPSNNPNFDFFNQVNSKQVPITTTNSKTPNQNITKEADLFEFFDVKPKQQPKKNNKVEMIDLL